MPACCNRFRASASARTGRSAGTNPVGFTPNGVGDNLEPADRSCQPGQVNSDGSPNKPNVGISDAAGTAGGYGPDGVNGSNVALPFGLDPARTPVMGSYDENTVAAKATSAWYQLPPRTPDRPLVVVAAAGAIWSYDEDGDFNYGQSLKLEWGVHRPDGSYQALGEVQPIDVVRAEGMAQPAFPAGLGAAGGQRRAHRRRRPEPEHRPVVRLHPAAGADAGDRAAAARFADPCADGHRDRGELPVPAAVLRAPRGRRTARLPDHAQPQADCRVVEHVAVRRGRRPVPVHQALLRTSTVPTYLRDDWYRDWGSIERYERLVPADAGARRRRRAGHDDGVRLDPRRTDQGAAMTAEYASEHGTHRGQSPSRAT